MFLNKAGFKFARKDFYFLLLALFVFAKESTGLSVYEKSDVTKI
ncbi:MAG: hypothetical protein VZR56_04185 [Treponema sp.]|nr:hypothetical protein [Treponema sp.]